MKRIVFKAVEENEVRNYLTGLEPYTYAAFEEAEGAAQCHCYVTFCHLQNVVEIRRGTQLKTMKTNKMHMSKTNKQKNQSRKQTNKNKPRDLHIGQPHFGPRKIKE